MRQLTESETEPRGWPHNTMVASRLCRGVSVLKLHVPYVGCAGRIVSFVCGYAGSARNDATPIERVTRLVVAIESHPLTHHEPCAANRTSPATAQ